MFKLAKKFLSHVVPGVVRPLHIMWNQVIGFFFLALAGWFLPSIIRDIGKPDAFPKLALVVPFTIVLIAFGIHSFLKARKISRS